MSVYGRNGDNKSCDEENPSRFGGGRVLPGETRRELGVMTVGLSVVRSAGTSRCFPGAVVSTCRVFVQPHLPPSLKFVRQRDGRVLG